MYVLLNKNFKFEYCYLVTNSEKVSQNLNTIYPFITEHTVLQVCLEIKVKIRFHKLSYIRGLLSITFIRENKLEKQDIRKIKLSIEIQKNSTQN